MSGITTHLYETGRNLRNHPRLIEYIAVQHRALYNPFLQPGAIVITAVQLLPRNDRSVYSDNGAPIDRFDALVKYVARDTAGDPEADGRAAVLVQLAEDVSPLAAAEYHPRTLPVYDMAAILEDPFFLIADISV
jgi:hypothetical protein